MPSEARIFRATAWLLSPSAQASTTRARRANRGWLRARWASDWSRSRSSSVKIRALFGSPGRRLARRCPCQDLLQTWTYEAEDLYWPVRVIEFT